MNHVHTDTEDFKEEVLKEKGVRISPTTVESRDVLGVEDYCKKLDIPIQKMKSTSISDGLKREKIYLQLQTRGMNLQCCRKEDAPVAI
jgi:hypothetical protein